MLTAAADEARRADTGVAGAFRIMALASILQSSRRRQAKEATAPPPPPPPAPPRGKPWLRAAGEWYVKSHLAGSVLASWAVGDAMCCKVEVVEDDLFALDVQLTYTA